MKRILSFVLAVCMVVGMLPAIALTAHAAPTWYAELISEQYAGRTGFGTLRDVDMDGENELLFELYYGSSYRPDPEYLFLWKNTETGPVKLIEKRLMAGSMGFNYVASYVLFEGKEYLVYYKLDEEYWENSISWTFFDPANHFEIAFTMYSGYPPKIDGEEISQERYNEIRDAVNAGCVLLHSQDNFWTTGTPLSELATHGDEQPGESAIIASGTCGDNLNWILGNVGVLAISGTGEMWDYCDGITPWNAHRDSIIGISIKSGVTSVGDSAFVNCDKLKSVIIPDGVATIGASAFNACSSLMYITIPSGITTIENSVFQGCSSLARITIPEGAVSIEDGTFQGCSSLTTISIPNTITSIGESAFGECSALSDVYYGGSLEEWCALASDGIATGNEHLVQGATIHFVNEDGETYFGGTCGANLTWTLNEDTGVLTISGTGEMWNWGSSSNHAPWYDSRSSITAIVMEEGITTIGSHAFFNCSPVTTITIPAGVTSIGEYAFDSCSGLTSIVIPEGVISIGADAFRFCENLTTVLIPDSVTAIEEETFMNCYDLVSVTIPESVTSIGVKAFYQCSSLRDAVLPEGVMSIGESAFEYCSNLTNVTLPKSVTSIERRAFYRCGNLTSIAIPNGVTTIRDYTFLGCSGLNNVVIPNSISSIGLAAFRYCDALSSVYYDGTREEWDTLVSNGVGQYNDCLINAPNLYFIGENIPGMQMIAKNAHTILVADNSEDPSHPNPVAGARVVIDGTEYITNEDGIVTTTDYGEKTVEVFAEGYRDKAEFYVLKEETARIFIMEEDKEDGLPYITLCTAARNGKAPYVDLRDQALHYTQNKGDVLVLWLEGNWNGHGAGTFNVYQEAANGQPARCFEVPDGSCLNIVPGKIFQPGVQIKVQMVAADGTRSEIVDLNIEIDSAPPEPGETSPAALQEGVGKLNWLGSFPIESDDDIFTKLLTTDMSFAGDLIPFTIATDYNEEDGTVTIRGGFGLLTNEDSKELLDGDDDEDGELEKAWDEFKDQVIGYKEADNPEEYIENIKKKYNEQLVPSELEGAVNAELDVFGFTEATIDSNGKIIKDEGVLVVDGEAGAIFGKTFLAGPIPLYFEFKPGVEVGAELGIDVYTENFLNKIALDFKNVELALPKASLEGGVGVRGIVATGVEGEVKLMVTRPDPEPSSMDTHVDMTVSGAINMTVLLVADYSWDLGETPLFHFYPKENAASVLAAAMEDVEPELTLVSRDYLTKATRWNAPAPTVLAGDDSDVPDVLQEGVMPEAMPQIHQIGEQQVMLFLRDVQERTIGNHTQLVYSVCQDGIWSEPQPVWESDSADFFFSSAAVNDELVVAWQKSSQVTVSDNAEDLLAEIAESSEICFASWDAETGSFSNQMYVTNNDLIDMMPAVATDGENITVSWVRNDANSVDGTEGSYGFYQTSITSEGPQPEELLYTTEDYVAEIASGMDGDGTHLIFSAMNDSNSVDLYSLDGGVVTKLVASQNPAGLSYADGMFLWQNDGSLYSYVPGADEAEVMVSADVAPVSASYEYVTNGTASSVVWTDANENGYQIKASVRTNKGWTAPVVLTGGSDDSVPFMDAVLLDDGHYSVAFTTANYDDEERLALTTLSYVNVEPKTSVSIELAHLNHPDWVNGTQEIDIALENSGCIPVNHATITVTTEDGSLLNKSLDMELMPGESVIFTETLDIHTISTEMQGVVGVHIENDVDESDNTMTVNLGEVDASLKLDTYENGDEFMFVLTASNNSTTAANAVIRIIEDSRDGAVLDTKNIGIITNEENIQCLFTIDRSEVDFAGKENKTYFFDLSTLESDWYDSDNVLTYTIKAPSDIEVDPDGEMQIVEMVLPERVEIVESVLNFSSLEDDSVQLHAAVYPEEASDRAVYWSADNNDIVYVTEDGVVTPLREGSTVITAMVAEDILDSIVVTVTADDEGSTEPSDPTDPEEPSDPTEPSEPTDPEVPEGVSRFAGADLAGKTLCAVPPRQPQSGDFHRRGNGSAEFCH